MKTQCADNKCSKILSKHFAVGLCRNANYVVNTIEKLSGYGKDDTGIPIPGKSWKTEKGDKMDAQASDCLSLWSKW